MRSDKQTIAVGSSASNKPLPKDEYLERQWIGLIADKRDRSSMDLLYHAYRSKLGSFLYRMIASRSMVEDIYNEVMLIVWRKAETFNGDSKVSTWIFSIAYRQALQVMRKEDKHASDEFDEQDFSHQQDDLIEEKQLLRKALKCLSENHRRVVELSYFCGWNYKEIANIVNSSENTIKTRMFHAKQKLKENLIRLGGSGA